MKKYIHRHHFYLGWLLLVISLGILFISVMWARGIIDLPPSLVFYAKELAAKVAKEPKATGELELKFHRQEHSLSCEPATLKIVLDYYGMDLSETDIINKMPFDRTQKSGNIWGDPDKGFVGIIDGKAPYSGYGIHWKPLAETARNWKKAETIEGGTAEDLVKNIIAGRPVIVWGYLGRGNPVSWQTPEGKKINTIVGEHTRVVYGFKGPAEDPEGFFVMDPIYGPSFWGKDVFIRNWDVLGRTGLVVFP